MNESAVFNEHVEDGQPLQVLESVLAPVVARHSMHSDGEVPAAMGL